MVSAHADCGNWIQRWPRICAIAGRNVSELVLVLASDVLVPGNPRICSEIWIKELSTRVSYRDLTNSKV